MKEIFKDIQGYKGMYQVSNAGRVYSVPRLDSIGRKCGGYFLKLTVNPRHGYLQVGLSKDGKIKPFLVHQLMAITFLNHVPNGFEKVINHIDFNKHNNRVDNLEVVTNRENCNKKHINTTSKYIGVSWMSSKNKWRAKITIKRKDVHLGMFAEEKKASKMYFFALNNLDLYNGIPSLFRSMLQNRIQY